jgi:hypothetical protein
MIRLVSTLLLVGPAAFVAWAQTVPTNDYPTAARVDYVIGCMAANGNTRQAMLQCSCSLDTIATMLPYADYEKAETALSLQQGGAGDRGALFRDPPEIRTVLERLRQAQAEANIECFK